MCLNKSLPFSALGRVALLCLALNSLAHAQLTDATLKGSVTDPSGKLVPRALVVATSEATGQTRSATTGDSGDFNLPSLPPGFYSVKVSVDGFRTFEQQHLELSVGRVTEIDVRLELAQAMSQLEVSAQVAKVPVSAEGRLSDTVERNRIANLPIPNRDVFYLTSLNAGAVPISGTAFSYKITASPSVSVNGNRHRGNNYVLDGSMDTDTLNTGEPAIVPSLESVEEVQIQTDNFSSEYGRGNGSVVNIRTLSGTNKFHGKVWEYDKNAAMNARNFFTRSTPPLVFNEFGANFGGPIIKNRTFFFGSFEGSRNSFGEPLSFQVETPEFRNYVFNNAPSSVAATLLKSFPMPAPLPGSNGQEYQGEVDLTLPQGGVIPGTGTTQTFLNDTIASDQYLARIDHLFNGGKDTLTGRWINEFERDNGASGILSAGTGASSTLGRYTRGFRDLFHGNFSNLNVGEVHAFDRMVNDARFSLQDSIINYGRPYVSYPLINVTGLSAPFGDPANQASRYRVYEFRDTISFAEGKHLIRTGFELRRIFLGVRMGPAAAGTFNFDNLLNFAADNPFQQSLVVDPSSGEPVTVAHYYGYYETAAFVQDDWKATSRLTLNLGVRYDYLGTPTSERYGHMSNLVFGSGSSYTERLANAGVKTVSGYYSPEKFNFSPRIGLAYDPFGDGKSSIRAGFSIAYGPPHGLSLYGESAAPPYSIQATLQPDAGIGTSILYGIPVPYNPEFKTQLNAQGGVVTPPGAPGIRVTLYRAVDPNYKTQYSESWFFNLQREIARKWIVEVGYVGTTGINLERIDDINRFNGDLLDGKLDRINSNFGTISYVTNGATSSYNAFTAEVRHQATKTLTVQANYRWSKWLDDNSDTSPGLVTNDVSEPNNGPENEACLKCDRARSMWDIPRRFTASAVWAPDQFQGRGTVDKLARNWQVSTIIVAQSGRPFDVWCSASFQAGCDFNADGGGNMLGGFADRPNAPAAGAVKSSFSKGDFLTGVFNPNVFSKPAPGTNGTLGRNVFRGPQFVNVDLSLGRSFQLHESASLQLRLDAYNSLNNVNLFLPNNDMALALKPGGVFSNTSNFGKSTQAYDPRVLEISAKFTF